MEHMGCHGDEVSVSPQIETTSDDPTMIQNPDNRHEGKQNRVADWIQECKEPVINLLDDAMKLPGLSSVEWS
jgi:hypothetical protein